MKYKVWLENMESAESIFKRLSNVIDSGRTYQDAVKSLRDEGVEDPFASGKTPVQVGHKWADSFYNHIVGEKGVENKELDKELDDLAATMVEEGFLKLNDPNPWHFFVPPGYKKENEKCKPNKKIHLKIPKDRLGLLNSLVTIIKQNSKYVRQFKFSKFGGSFETRRDNFIIYLSCLGEENQEVLIKAVQELNLEYDIGQDFKSESDLGITLSQTQLISLKLAFRLVNKPKTPLGSSGSLGFWNTEMEYLKTLNLVPKQQQQKPAGGSSIPDWIQRHLPPQQQQQLSKIPRAMTGAWNAGVDSFKNKPIGDMWGSIKGGWNRGYSEGKMTKFSHWLTKRDETFRVIPYI